MWRMKDGNVPSRRISKTSPNAFAATAYPTYSFVPAQRDGQYLLVLIDTQKASPKPLYIMALETSAQWDVAAKWLLERESQWQTWGAMARISLDDLIAHIDDLLDAEPMDLAIEACLLTESLDGRRLTLSEIVRDRRGNSIQRQVWCRTFKSKAQCRQAKAWILRDYPQLDELARFARDEGSNAVDMLLEARRFESSRCESLRYRR